MRCKRSRQPDWSSCFWRVYTALNVFWRFYFGRKLVSSCTLDIQLHVFQSSLRERYLNHVWFLACEPFWEPLEEVLFCPSACVTQMTVACHCLCQWHLSRDFTFRRKFNFCSASARGLFSVPAFPYVLPLHLLPYDFWLFCQWQKWWASSYSCGSCCGSTLQMSWLPPAPSLRLSEDEDMDCPLLSSVFTLLCALPCIHWRLPWVCDTRLDWLG